MSEDDAVEDDDWFERAVGEDRDRDGSADGEPSSGGEASDDETVDDGVEDGEADAGGDDADGDDADVDDGGTDDAGFGTVDPDPDDLDEAFEAATEAAGDDGAVEEGVGQERGGHEGGGEGDPFADAAGDDPFDDSAGDDPFGTEDFDDDADGFGDGVGGFDDGAFGGSGGGGSGGAGSDGGGGSDAGGGSGGELFEDDFSAAFGGGGDDETFDDEDFDSDIPRLDVGIAGLDNMIRGGVPERHLMVAIGSAGTGKTTFGLQYLHHGLENGESGVYITLEQTHDSIVATAAEHGWDFEAYEDEGDLAVIDLDPVEMANSLDNIRSELPELIEAFDADRLVLDSVSLLEMMYDDQARRRTEVFDFTRSLKKAGVTTLLTSEADEDNAYASRHGIIEYLTDAVFVLQYVRSETQETRLAVEIQKIRNANHSRETKPYEITDDGISVYEQANIF